LKKKFRTAVGLRMAVGSVVYKWFLKNKDALYGWHKKAPKPVPKPPKPPAPTTLYMYDDINISLIPFFAKAVAGYVDGRWQTYLKLLIRCPFAKHMSIAVFPGDNADCLDCEPGDATNIQAPAWVKRQRALRRVGRKYQTRLPVLYTSAANGNALNDVCRKAGLEYGVDYLWWSAHYSPTLGKHFCGPKCYPGLRYEAHGTQYTDHANSKNLDLSILSPGWFK
jgi:hypothetical protein